MNVYRKSSALCVVLEHVYRRDYDQLKAKVAEGMRLLLQARADPNGTEADRNRRPLEQCLRAVEPAKILIEAGATLGTDKSNEIVRHLVEHADVEVIDLVLEVAQRQGIPCRDVLSAAAKKGSAVAKSQL